MSELTLGYITDAKGIGRDLRSLRTERRQILRDVESGTGINIATLSRIENGLGTKFDTVVRLISYYGLAVRLEERQP